jgi:transposase
VMEATGVYWRPIWHVLEEVPSFQLELVNAHHVKRVPGRKTDVSDAAWLAQLAECGLLRGSFVPPPTIAHLRDLTRYRKKLIADRAKEAQRIQKLLEDAGVKLDSVVTDILGQSARDMLDGLLAGEQDTAVLANHARGRMRAKVPDLRLALEGRFGEHHHFLLRMHLQHVDHLTAGIQQLDEEVARLMAPFAEPVRRLCTIPGVGRRSAEIILAEIGVDMGRFPTAGHLASWAGMCPGHHESAGKQRSGRARKGNAALRSVLCEVAWAATHTKNTYLSAQFRRLCRRFGKGGSNKAVFALGHTILVIVWHLLQRETDYQELGADYFAQRHETDAYRQRLVHQLEKLGHRVTLEPSAA